MFRNDDAIVRLVDAIAIDQYVEWAVSARRHLSKECVHGRALSHARHARGQRAL
nr:hypothetical protein [Ferrimicrobium acidiphilum]